MPAINFKKQFARFVETGEKKQTIRPFKNKGRNIQTGDHLYLYTGMRTKSCYKLGEAECVKTAPICLYLDGRIILDGNELSEPCKFYLAQKDGFRNFEEMYEFFIDQYGLENFPFYGLLIIWKLLDLKKPRQS